MLRRLGLATVMVITLTGPEWGALGALAGPMAGADPASPDLPLSLPASFELPWDGQL